MSLEITDTISISKTPESIRVTVEYAEAGQRRVISWVPHSLKLEVLREEGGLDKVCLELSYAKRDDPAAPCACPTAAYNHQAGCPAAPKVEPAPGSAQ